MARAAFAELRDGKAELFGLDGKSFPGRPEDIQLLFLSRLDCEVRCLPLPPVAERELATLIRYRLRSVYPGSLEGAVIDHLAQRRGNGLVAVAAIVDREALEKVRRTAPRAALSLLCATLLNTAHARRDGCIACELPGYLEVLKFEGGALVESVVVKRSRPPEDARRVLRLLGNGVPAPPLFLAPRQELQETARRLDAGDSPRTCALESLEIPRRSTASLFRPPRRLRFPRPAVTRAALAAAIVLLSVCLVLRQAGTRQAELSVLRGAVLGSQAEGQRTADLVARYAAVNASVNALTRARPVDVYALLADLRSELGPSVVLQDLVLQEGSFQLQADGPGPLELMQRLIACPRFQSVRLLQATPLGGSSRQRFIVTGRYSP